MNKETRKATLDRSWFGPLLVVATALAVAPAPAFAQLVGERVRIGLAAGTVTGAVVESDGDR